MSPTRIQLPNDKFLSPSKSMVSTGTVSLWLRKLGKVPALAIIVFCLMVLWQTAAPIVWVHHSFMSRVPWKIFSAGGSCGTNETSKSDSAQSGKRYHDFVLVK